MPPDLWEEMYMTDHPNYPKAKRSANVDVRYLCPGNDSFSLLFNGSCILDSLYSFSISRPLVATDLEVFNKYAKRVTSLISKPTISGMLSMLYRKY